MRGVGKDATKLFESVSPINIQSNETIDPSFDRSLFLRTHRSSVAGARLGQLSEHPSEMRGGKAEPWLDDRFLLVLDGKPCLGHHQLFIDGAEPDNNKLHEWVEKEDHLLIVSFVAINENVQGKREDHSFYGVLYRYEERERKGKKGMLVAFKVILYEGNRCSKKGLIPYFIEFVRIYEWMLVCRWCDWRNDDS